jgi:hypothetical protein
MHNFKLASPNRVTRFGSTLIAVVLVLALSLPSRVESKSSNVCQFIPYPVRHFFCPSRIGATGRGGDTNFKPIVYSISDLKTPIHYDNGTHHPYAGLVKVVDEANRVVDTLQFTGEAYEQFNVKNLQPGKIYQLQVVKPKEATILFVRLINGADRARVDQELKAIETENQKRLTLEKYALFCKSNLVFEASQELIKLQVSEQTYALKQDYACNKSPQIKLPKS